VCDGLDDDCDDVADNDSCPQGCYGSAFDGHRYLFCALGTSGTNRSWEWAMGYCEDLGQTLVRVETEAENEFIYENLSSMDGSGSAWMAATDRYDEDLWVWALGDDEDSWQPFYDADDNDPIDDSFVDWNQGEPDNSPGTLGSGADCGAFESLGDSEWGWADRQCSSSYSRVICEDVD
jgi:hypothetical protein